jgi:hypothetical protein
MYNVILRRVGATIIAMGSSKYYILWVCVALVIQHAMRMRHIVNCGLWSTILSHITSYTARLTFKNRASYI